MLACEVDNLEVTKLLLINSKLIELRLFEEKPGHPDIAHLLGKNGLYINEKHL